MRALRSLAVAVIGVAWLAASAPADASVTIGQTGADTTCMGNRTTVQDATAAPPVYSVPAGGGVITSWSTAVPSVSPGQTLKLKVLRRDAIDPAKFLVVGEDGFRPLNTAGVESFPNPTSPAPVRIPVSGGDLLGQTTGPVNGVACVNATVPAGDSWRVLLTDPAVGTTPTFGAPVAMRRENISAVVEPDADGDGFGDETQDLCRGLAGTVNGCPAADLAVSETASPNPSPVHGQFSYLVQVRNTGPSALPAGLATVADTVGPSVTLISANSPAGPCTMGAVVRCPAAGLAPGTTTTITVTVRADTEGGKANAATVSYAGDPNAANDTAGFTATVVPAPIISAANVSPNTWRLGSALPKISRKPPVGTTISFKLSQAARATLTFAQPATGRKVGKRCKTLTRANRKKAKCTIPNVRGTLALNAHAGTNKVRFQGKLSRSTRLKPGRYTLTISATDSAGNRSNAKATSFTIVR